MDAGDARLRAGTDEVGDDVVVLGDLLVSRKRASSLAEAVRRALAEHHEQHPLERGAAREAVRAVTGLDPEPFERLIGGLADVVEEGALLRLATHRVTLAPEQLRARDGLLSRIGASGFSPPLGRELGADPALLRALVDSGDLVRIEDFYLTAESAAEARTRVRRRIEERGPVTVAEIRDLLGTSRKYAVPLCEWLDSTGATRRQGDLRALGPTP
ncbi:MAG: SelB C-terminal domain-containing protein, partial [Actinomycetota bacterium]